MSKADKIVGLFIGLVAVGGGLYGLLSHSEGASLSASILSLLVGVGILIPVLKNLK